MKMSVQEQRVALYRRAQSLLGREAFSAMNTPPLGKVFSTMMAQTETQVGSPDKISDEQILRNYELANEMYPAEFAFLARAYSEQGA
jgi:predicted Zn-dependent protease